MGVPPAAAVRFGQPTSQQYSNQSSSRSAANNHGGGCSASSRRSSGNGKLGFCDKIENYVAELGHWYGFILYIVYCIIAEHTLDFVPYTRGARHSLFVSENGAVWRAIIIGQFLSLVLCFMTLLNHQINTAYQINLPTAQNLPHYVMMLLVYTTWMSCRGAGNGLFSVLRARGWRYLLLALIDVEANTLIAASHQFTSLASVQLLDCVAIPVALALSCLVLGVRYRMVHIVGVSICLMGVGCLVWAGIEESKDSAAAPAGKNQLVGDMLCLGGAVLFSIITVLQELTVKSVDIIEYLGMMGFFGTIICGSQVAVLERMQLEAFQYENVLLISFLVIYCITQFVFYSLIPVVLYETGATSLQLTLLTADFFNILLGMLIHQYKVRVERVLFNTRFARRAHLHSYLFFFSLRLRAVPRALLPVVRPRHDRHLHLRYQAHAHVDEHEKAAPLRAHGSGLQTHGVSGHRRGRALQLGHPGQRARRPRAHLHPGQRARVPAAVRELGHGLHLVLRQPGQSQAVALDRAHPLHDESPRRQHAQLLIGRAPAA
ncbi:unnamed protein product [Trichogramma brassicae]|uniref:EamA domain-containing protein n=1 Tax=Trichogramma brassicae TaxID=86971 RepID=A0A6H5IY12_9HYME|nr:unnamed protein product [Trichogramma brassicae]